MSQCIQQWMKQFSNTRRWITTAGYNELRWNSVSKNCHPFLFFKCPTSFQKPSPVCFLWLIFACIQLSVLTVSDDKKNFIFIQLGKVKLILLTEWQEESYQCLRCSAISSNPSLKLVFPYNLSASCGPGSVVRITTGYGLDGRGSNTVGARFSANFHTGPVTHTASCTMGTGSCVGVICGRGVTLTPHPF